MRLSLKTFLVVAALAGAAMGIGRAEAAGPVPIGIGAAPQSLAAEGLVTPVRWVCGPYGRCVWRGGPRGWRGGGYYGPPRRFYRPRVVCRWRPSPWGPRRVCWRR
jgi:hypothetical protein